MEEKVLGRGRENEINEKYDNSINSFMKNVFEIERDI